MPKKSTPKKKLNLALQGGGAHGAYTWGALDRLLEEEDIEVEGVSATSAGAMNGAMYTTGLKCGGPEEAKRRLAAFWNRIRDAYPLNQPPWSIWAQAFNGIIPPAFNPTYALGGAVSLLVSPYQLNLLDINPLRDTLEELIDFADIKRSTAPRLFVCATDVQSGRARIFKGKDLTVEALLASACLPTLYKAVEIDGRAYWDGGFTGNPALWPLIYECATQDLMVIHVNPIDRAETPRDARSIHDRVNEISFNSNLLNEIRAINTIDRLVAEGYAPDQKYKRMRIHAVSDPETMMKFGAATKAAPEARMLDTLFESGRASMARWLEENKDKIGVESSVNLREAYL